MAQRNFVFIVAALAIAALLATIVGLRRQPETSRDENRRAGHDTRALPAATSEQLFAQTEQKSKSIASTFDRLSRDCCAASRFNVIVKRTGVCFRSYAPFSKRCRAKPRRAKSKAISTLGNDAVTQLDLTIGPGGVLGDASSLRVFLLDYLGQIDRPAAAALARQILTAPTSPDEWAISLRNVARVR